MLQCLQPRAIYSTGTIAHSSLLNTLKWDLINFDLHSKTSLYTNSSHERHGCCTRNPTYSSLCYVAFFLSSKNPMLLSRKWSQMCNCLWGLPRRKLQDIILKLAQKGKKIHYRSNSYPMNSDLDVSLPEARGRPRVQQSVGLLTRGAWAATGYSSLSVCLFVTRGTCGRPRVQQYVGLFVTRGAWAATGIVVCWFVC